jgi:hypothetical protein
VKLRVDVFSVAATRGWLCCRGLLMWRDLTSNRLDFYIAQNNVDTLQRRRRSAGIRIGHARRSRDPIFLSGRWITKLSFLSLPPSYTQLPSLWWIIIQRGLGLVCIFLRRSPFSPLRSINTPKSFSLSLPNIIRKVGTIRKYGERRWPRFQPYTACVWRCYLDAIWFENFRIKEAGDNILFEIKKEAKAEIFHDKCIINVTLVQWISFPLCVCNVRAASGAFSVA